MSSLLSLGIRTLRSHPPMGPLPCFELRVLGENAKDPGFENHLANTDAGSWGDSIPTDASAFASSLVLPSSGLLWIDPADNDPANWTGADNSSGWYHPCLSSPNGQTATHWVVTDADPRSGTYHARYQRDTGGTTSPDLGFYTQGTCDIKFATQHIAYSARVDPGDTVDFEVYAKVSDLTGIPYAAPEFQFFEEDFSGAGVDTGSTQDLGTSYTLVSHSAVAPAGSYYVVAYFDVNAMNNGCIADADDGSLAIS